MSQNNSSSQAAARLLLVTCILAFAAGAHGQQSPPAPDDDARLRATSLLFGVGNSMGWLGGQGERYFKGDRVSLFFGLGYTNAYEDGRPTGVTVAGGARLFTPGKTHRAFLEFSASQVLTETYTLNGENFPGSRRYGPGVQVGYQYLGKRGFTALLSMGVGYAVGASPGVSATRGLLGLGLGYTWRR